MNINIKNNSLNNNEKNENNLNNQDKNKKTEGLGITQPYTSIELEKIKEINVKWTFNILERIPDGNKEILLNTNKIVYLTMNCVLEENSKTEEFIRLMILDRLIDYLRINSKKDLGYTFIDDGLIRIRNIFDDELFENGLITLSVYFDYFKTINNLLDIDITFEIDCI